MTYQPGVELVGALHNRISQVAEAAKTTTATADTLPSPEPMNATTYPEAARWMADFYRELADQAEKLEQAATKLKQEARSQELIYSEYGSQLRELFR